MNTTMAMRKNTVAIAVLLGGMCGLTLAEPFVPAGLAAYQAAARAAPDANRGKAFWNAQHKDERGNSMSCATCHVVVAPDWSERAGNPSPFEDDMLDITEAGRQPTSRLSCQIKMSAALDGIVVSVPEA